MIRRRFHCTNWLVVLVLTSFACGYGILKPFGFAQVVDHRATVEQIEDVEFDEDEEESADLESLFEIRRELEEELDRFQTDAEDTQRRIQIVDRLVELSREASKIEELIEQTQDEALAMKLRTDFERIETELATNEELLELEHEIAEFKHEGRDARDEEGQYRFQAVESILSDLKKTRSITVELMHVYLEGPTSAAAALEKAKANAHSRIQKAYQALEIIELLEEAEKDDDERIEELETKLQHLMSELDGEPVKASPAKNVSTDLQPILVNSQTLAPYANVNVQRDVAPLLRKYCFDCHDNNSSSSELNLERLLAESPIVKHRKLWINVIEQSKNHVMPPVDEQQPSRGERERIVLSLHQAVINFDYRGIVDPGFESARRMTHREFSNTVRDLFGVEIDIIDRFPDDLTATSGFDNSANSLFIQPLLLERYVRIAESVVNVALPSHPTTPQELAAHKRIFVRTPTSTEDVRAAATQILRRFLLRAFRRPPSQREVDRYVERVAREVEQGADFESAVKGNLRTILISPSFLLITEEKRFDERDAYRISDWELASRLSYFIWASMPDDELLMLASTGRLGNEPTLTAQVARMIKDRKADALGSVFAAQWLGSQHLGVRTRLDPIDNPWCTDSLMKAMRDETSMFFNSLVRENRPITELVNADYTFLNEELAKLYRITGVNGAEMRRVKLAKASQRGGIFGHGSLLAVTSFPGRTSPVVRGKWILDTVLGTPPPPPPPNVSELSDDIENRRRLSFREKLELHRQKPNCYACHSEMDPLGLSLENFDHFGRYRTRRGRKQIDVSGELPNGTRFEGLPGLKRVIVEQRREDLIRQVSQKMLSYALGRQLEYYDEPEIRRIVKRTGADGDRMQTLVREIVMSFPFRYKKNRLQIQVTSNQTAEENR